MREGKFKMEVDGQTLSRLQVILERMESASRKPEETFSAIERFWSEFSTLSDVAEIASRMTDLGEICRLLLKKAMSGTGSTIGSLILREPVGENLRIVATEGWNPTMIGSIDPDESLAGKVIREGEPVLAPDSVERADFPRHGDDNRYTSSSFVIAPLKSGAATFGAVCLTERRDDRPYSSEDLVFLEHLFRQAEGPLQNARDLELTGIEDRKKDETIERQRLQLAQAQEKIVHAEKLTSLGRMVSGVAHELNNPITSILGFTEILLDEELPEEQRDKVRIVFAEAQRARQILQNLLAFLRYREPEKKPVDLNSVVETIAALRRYELSRRDIDLSTDMDPNLPTTLIDVDQIQLVLLNLLNNAAEAMPPKGQRQIRIGTRGGEDTVTFWVSDTGVGIPESIRERVFDPFYSTKPGNANTGLGLTLSKDIVEYHQGRIRLRSSSIGGTRVQVELPRIQPVRNEVPLPEQDPFDPTRFDRLTAIVIEDEEYNAELVRKFLEMAGFDVTLSMSGVEALQVLLHENFDLIVCDLLMPELDGKRLYREIQKYRPNLCGRFVFMTGDTADPQTHLFVKNNRVTLVAKPFTRKELLDAVTNLLGDEVRESQAAQASTG
jgi:signal transduction histidine kinase/CheY-like chemotaxis protein